MDILMSQTDLGKNVYPGKIELDGSRIDFSGEGLIIRSGETRKLLSPFLDVEYIAGKAERVEKIKGFFSLYSFINAGYHIEILKGYKLDRPLIINQYSSNKRSRINEYNYIFLGEDSAATIVFDYSNEDESETIHSRVTEIHVADNAVANIIKLQRGNNSSLNLDYNTAEVYGAGEINWYTIEVGSRESISSYHTELKGYGSGGFLSSIYFVDQERDFDLNYTMELTGARSLGRIESRGVLMDKARKMFRGNLIFNTGAVRADGSEKETVLLLSPEARSETIPALYCGEEDVSGEHAASAGRISDKQLYYLMSRGLSLSEARRVLVESSLNPLIERIPLLEIREIINEEIQRRLYDE